MDDIAWLEAHGQRLGLAPALGGGVAAWQRVGDGAPVDLWRPWRGDREDRYTLASFPMVPWSNRISHGGFAHEGRFHAIAPNRRGEPYPIHGDGWQQTWTLERESDASAVMRLASRQFAGHPYAYDAEQRFRLVEDGLDQSLRVVHRGDDPLPYGLGLHPWFPRDDDTRLTARVDGVWLSGSDPLPTGHTSDIAPDWDLNASAPMQGRLIDNGYTGWDGQARIDWPRRGLSMQVTMAPLRTPGGAVPPAFCLVYRPPAGDAFCFEPITQPIDAFHLEGRPGLVTLQHGESLELQVHWRLQRA